MARSYMYYIAVGSKLIESSKMPTSITDLIDYTMHFNNENELLKNLFENGLIRQEDCDNVSSGVTKLRIFKCHKQELYLLESDIPYVDAIPYINYPVNKIKELLKDKNFVSQLQKLFSWNDQVWSSASTLSINLDTPDYVPSEIEGSIDNIIGYLLKTPLYKYQLGMLIKNYVEKKESMEVKQPQFDEPDPYDYIIDMPKDVQQPQFDEPELDYVTNKLTRDYSINPNDYDGEIPEDIAKNGTSPDEEEGELLSLIRRYNACNRGRK